MDCSLTVHNVHVFVIGGRKPVTLRLPVRRLHDIAIQENITCCHHQLWIKISLVAISACNKRCKETEINGNIGNTNSKSQQKVTEGTEIHKKTAMKKQKEHDMVLKLQISCNKKELRFYSKTEIFGKVVGVWKWLLTLTFSYSIIYYSQKI